MALVTKLVSPFQCGTDTCKLLNQDVLQHLVIRVEKIDSVLVHIKLHGNVDDDSADFYLVGGDSIELKGFDVNNGQNIQFKAVTGNPKIYWWLR